MLHNRLLILALCLLPFNAKAEFIISSAIVEFSADAPMQQDIELISRSQDADYIEAEVNLIPNPGDEAETRQIVDDPAASAILVTPSKTILAGSARRVVRFVLTKPLDERERIYRVAFKPVIKGINSEERLGLKVLVGYEALVILRPSVIKSAYRGNIEGKTLTVTNTGNTNILLQNGKQCPHPDKCESAPNMRIYPGKTANVTLPLSTPATYNVWDGKETKTVDFH